MSGYGSNVTYVVTNFPFSGSLQKDRQKVIVVRFFTHTLESGGLKVRAVLIYPVRCHYYINIFLIIPRIKL